METLKLDCEQVSSIGSSISTVANQMTALGEEIANYELDESDDFNFITPCSAIKANVLNSAEKMTNTAEIINTVIENHTEIQNALTFDNYVEGTTKTTVTVPGTVSGDALEASSYETTPSYSNPSSMYSAAGAYYSTAATTIAETYGVTKDSTTTETNTKLETETTTKEEKKIVKSIKFGANLAAPTLGFVSSSKTTKENEIDDRLEVKYDDKTGLAKVDDNYVIRCDDTIGKVGDAVIITTASGTAISCVIGSTYTAETGKTNTLDFYSNKNVEEITEIEGTSTKDFTITKADNYGTIDKDKFKEETEEQNNKKTTSIEKTSEEETTTETKDETKETTTKETKAEEQKTEETKDTVTDGLTDFKEKTVDVFFPEITIGNTGNAQVTITSNPVVTNTSVSNQTPVVTTTPVVKTEPVYNWTTAEPEVKQSSDNMPQLAPYIMKTVEEENDDNGGNY